MNSRFSLLSMLVICIGIFQFAQAQVTLMVNAIPANTPATDDIYVAGSFQGWNPGSAAHRLTHDTLQNIHFLTLGGVSSNIEFKFTRGDWTRVESDANGNFVPNRIHNTSAGDTLLLQIEGWEDLSGTGGGTAASNVSILTDSFYMPQLNRYRRIWLYLPPDYATSGTDYPVLYMHDGQNVFDANTSFAGEWEVDETLNYLHQNGDPGIIVVAIDNGQAQRIDEYGPWNNPSYGGGNGAAYIDFIAQTLKPYIDANYRTLPGRETTGLMGSSLGGLISAYGGIRYQNTFGRIGALSPSYWFNPEMYGFVTTTGKQAPMRIYQLAGSLEGSNMAGMMWQMQDTLTQAGFGSGEVLSVEKADGQHAEWFWKREFAAAYLWLFRNPATGVIAQDNASVNVSLYPNPAAGILHLSLGLAAAMPVEVKIFDLNGKEHYRMNATQLPAGSQVIEIPLDALELPAGLYNASISAGADSVHLKFLHLGE